MSCPAASTATFRSISLIDGEAAACRWLGQAAHSVAQGPAVPGRPKAVVCHVPGAGLQRDVHVGIAAGRWQQPRRAGKGPCQGGTQLELGALAIEAQAR